MTVLAIQQARVERFSESHLPLRQTTGSGTNRAALSALMEGKEGAWASG